MNIEVRPIEKSRLDQVNFDQLNFGDVFADHMVSCDYRDGAWQIPQIVPYGEFLVAPSLSAIHYGQSVFEGMKAFRRDDEQINIFRLPDHARRLQKSCQRMCMPGVPEDLFVEAIKTLIDLDRAWVPAQQGCALYLRPFVFATDSALGLKPSQTYRFMVISSPVASYYKDCLASPVRLMSSGGEFVRAVVGGTGEAKTAGNYAASLLPAQKAKEQGFDQILWLDGKEGRYVDEVGTMNIFFVIENTLVTPALSGSVLAGITRDSVIKLAQKNGLKVEERLVSIEEVLQLAQSGQLKEAFGTGTAAVISPIGLISHRGEAVTIGNGKTGPMAQKFYQDILSIQKGSLQDDFGWNVLI